MRNSKPLLDSDVLIQHCHAGEYETVKYLLDTHIFVPSIYANDNQCLGEAYFEAVNFKLVVLLCEYVPKIEYFESSALNWPKNDYLLELINKEKTKRLAQFLQTSLKSKEFIKSIKL